MPSRQQVFETGKSGITRSRSVFDLSHTAKFTMNAGRLTPCLAYTDVLPGDTHKLGMSMVCRSTTPVRPIMDNAYMQVEFWYVSNRSVLHRSSMSPALDDSNHSWDAFIGAQDNLLNMPIPGEVTLPGVRSFAVDPTSTETKEAYMKSVACYLDYPLEKATDSSKTTLYNPFAVLALYSVWSYAYREPNLWNPVTYSISVNRIVFTNNSAAGIANGGNLVSCELPKVCREHGYFGSALPWPQRNLNGVTLGLAGTAPIEVGSVHDFGGGLVLKADSEVAAGNAADLLGVRSADTAGKNLDVKAGYLDDYTGQYGYNGVSVVGSNMVANLNQVSAVAINELRYAFALQGYYEALARMGNRYDDILAYYGVYKDALDPCVPEYLGGKRIPLDVAQVNATGDNVGQLGAFSNTSSSDHYFTKSFTDFGTILGVCFIRHHDTVYQRMSKERTRIERFDYYNPAFANIGEVPVYSRELFIGIGAFNIANDDDKKTVEEDVFGYQEYGADYRYHENVLRGRLIPGIGDLGYWTYASDWANGGTYDENNFIDLEDFLDASGQVYDFDQTLETSAATAGYQFIVDMYFNWIAVRNIPAHSIPALLGGR